VEFRILGPLEVLDGGRVVSVGGRRKRAVLAILLLHLNRPISSERLIDELWGDRPPATALQTVRVHVSQIRKALGYDLLRTLPAGYALELDPVSLDAQRFERLAGGGRAALAVGEAASASALLNDALALWRGPALADFTYEPFAQAEIARLEDLRTAALGARIDADLALGGSGELVDELEALVGEHPLRERFRGQLMLALYRSGRQADALAAYRAARNVLVEELGLEPSPELRELETAILRQDASLVLGEPAPVPIAKPSSTRKTVTTLHVDLGSSVQGVADPEAFARRIEEPLERVLVAIGRHEGTVTAPQSDAVTATFGLPALHEDDALRAVRAAVDVREQLAGLVRPPRMGIATGEVVASDSTQPLGAVAGSAARVADAAVPGEILLDGATLALVANAVDVEPAAGPDVFRLRALTRGAPPFARRLEAPLVGRRRELASLLGAFERVLAAHEPELVVVAGPPGIGKSRLAGELIHAVGGRAATLVGRCLSYGQGITLWPLREMVREAAGDETRDAVGTLLQDEPDSRLVGDTVAGALGLVEVDRSAEETVWAFRRLFETLARSRPHVVVVEDAHWAEPALLDLLDYVARQAKGVPLLVLCLARPELLESRPAWASGAIELAPLSPEETKVVVDNMPGSRSLGRELRERVIARAEGNPLFAEQFVALLAAAGGGAVPTTAPTIDAILAARLDRLGPGERAVAERAAVVGREFTVEGVAALLPPAAVPAAARHLDALTRKVLVQPDRAVLRGQKGYRFQHALIHDAAYRRVPKQLRAELHERLGDWLERGAGRRVSELDEIIGYHLERACRYRVELGIDGEATERLSERAAGMLAAAGRRAFQRTDFGAAAGLLSRAVDLTARDDPATIELLNTIGTALGPLGELERQQEVLEEAIRRARSVGDAAGEWHARLEQRWTSEASPDEERTDAERALRVFEQAGDYAGATRASAILAAALLEAGRGAAADAQAEHALELARASQVNREQVRAQWTLADALVIGPRPVAAAIARCDRLLEEAPESVVGPVGVTRALGLLRAMKGEFDVGRELVGRARSIIEAIAHPRPLVAIALAAGRVELLAGDPDRAAELYREGLAIAREIRMDSAALGRSLVEADCLQGRVEDAVRHLKDVREPSIDRALEYGRWSVVLARVHALTGERVEAKRLAEAAAGRIASTDLLALRAELAQVLAETLWAEGRVEDAKAALGEAINLYERKGAVAAVARARDAVPLHELT
jgi:DNA-binding SARP family transcriptional activator